MEKLTSVHSESQNRNTSKSLGSGYVKDRVRISTGSRLWMTNNIRPSDLQPAANARKKALITTAIVKIKRK